MMWGVLRYAFTINHLLHVEQVDLARKFEGLEHFKVICFNGSYV